MGFGQALYRLAGAAYLVLFVMYFSFRAVYSLGENQLPWRIFVLLVEFLASMSVFFVVILKLKLPWTEWVDQPDGTKLAWYRAREQELGKSSVAVTAAQSVASPSRTMTIKKPVAAAKSPSIAVSVSKPHKDEENSVASDVSLDVDENSPVLKKHDSFVPAEDAGDIYTHRILVPCYREDLDIVRRTVEAALRLDYNREKVFVYLCDDGADPLKIEWARKMQESGWLNLMYVTRPAEHKGHGKAGNLNYCLKHIIYAGDVEPASTELVSIFDADMICAPHYARRLVPYFASNPAVVMVQTPQTFHNVPMNADFFDAHNVNFFQYLLPAMSEWNTTTCCGTNFMVSALALSNAGWFPTLSVTEDMYLAMKLLETGGIVRYHPEHLAVGEAPEDMRQIFQQRSRWAKGTIQIAVKDNPLKSEKLNLIQRLSFWNACWSYLTSAFFNPLFVVINSVAIIFGVFPVTEIDMPTALMFVGYYSVFYAMIHFTPVPQHYLSLWIVGKMGHFFSFMSLKAIFNVLKAEWGSKKNITFKVTQKKVNGAATAAASKAAKSRDSTHKDLVFHFIMVTVISFTVVYGIWILAGGAQFIPEIADERSTYQKRGIRMFCICWMVQFFIAYSLPIFYAYSGKTFSAQASILKTLSTIDSILSVGLIILTILMFQLRFVPQLPTFKDITDYPPTTAPFWMSDTTLLQRVEPYIYDTASKGEIPTIVMYYRPNRDSIHRFSAGGAADWTEYANYLKTAAKTISQVEFPVMVVLEPDWMFEKMRFVTQPTGEAGWIASSEIVSKETPLDQGTRGFLEYLKQDFDYMLDLFVDFSRRMFPKSRVYIDAAHPQFHSVTGNYALKLLGEGLRQRFQDLRISQTASWVRGVTFNVANFYTDQDVITVGAEAKGAYALNFVIDSSRNGGAFSQQNWTDIASCVFDPPNIATGQAPRWIPNTPTQRNIQLRELAQKGMDGNAWIKVPGAADGRLYPAGEFHSCLMGHRIECSNECPMVPTSRPVSCQCDGRR